MGEIQTQLVDLYESALNGEERSTDIEYDSRIYRVRAAPVRRKDGTIFAGISTTQDVTHQRALEEKLQSKSTQFETVSQQLELALFATETGLWQWDLETDQVHWDETVERSLGLSPGEFDGTRKAFEERVHPDDRDRIQEQLDRTLETGAQFSAEFRMKHEDGQFRWVTASGIVIEADGSRRLVGTHTDITERKQ